MQNDFEIMDHKIENHTDIGAALRIRRKSMCFYETRVGQMFLERA